MDLTTAKFKFLCRGQNNAFNVHHIVKFLERISNWIQIYCHLRNCGRHATTTPLARVNAPMPKLPVLVEHTRTWKSWRQRTALPKGLTVSCLLAVRRTSSNLLSLFRESRKIPPCPHRNLPSIPPTHPTRTRRRSHPILHSSRFTSTMNTHLRNLLYIVVVAVSCCVSARANTNSGADEPASSNNGIRKRRGLMVYSVTEQNDRTMLVRGNNGEAGGHLHTPQRNLFTSEGEEDEHVFLTRLLFEGHESIVSSKGTAKPTRTCGWQATGLPLQMFVARLSLTPLVPSPLFYSAG